MFLTYKIEVKLTFFADARDLIFHLKINQTYCKMLSYKGVLSHSSTLHRAVVTIHSASTVCLLGVKHGSAAVNQPKDETLRNLGCLLHSHPGRRASKSFNNILIL